MKKSFLWGIGLGLAAFGAPSIAQAQFSRGPADQGQYPSIYQPTSFPVPVVNNGRTVSTQGYNTSQAVHKGWVGPVQNQVRLVQNTSGGSGTVHQHVPAAGSGSRPLPPTTVDSAPAVSAPSVAVPSPVTGAPVASQPPVIYGAPSASSGTCGPCNNFAGQQTFAAPQPAYSFSTPSYQTAPQIVGQPAIGFAPVQQGFVANGPSQFGSPLAEPLRFGGNASHWFGGISGLVFQRVDDRRIRLTNNSNDPTNAFLTTRDARLGTAGGIQFQAGKYFNQGRNALAATYWGLFPTQNEVTVFPPAGGNLRSEIPFTIRGPGATSVPFGVQFPSGRDIYDWYDGSPAQRLRRDYEVHNIEISLLGFGLGGAAVAPGAANHNCRSCLGGPGGGLRGACCSRLRLGWSAGVRWFRFDDELEFAASDTDTVFGTTDDDVYYNNDVTNDLVGFQLGSILAYNVSNRANIYLAPKVGIYGNHIRFDTRVGTTGTAARILSPGHAFDGRDFDFRFSRTDFALLAELNAGASFRITKCWSANVGYRVLGASGVATAVGQIPFNFANANDIEYINNDSSLILHGGFFGATYNF